MTGKKINKHLWISILMVMVTWSVLLSGANAWWNEQWTYRKKIALDTTVGGADIKQNLVQFPVLIRLHSGNFDFTRVQENGEDLRFISSDDTTLLKYHIEFFDVFDEIALVWVNVPDIPGGNNQGAVWLYYGNGTAANGGDEKNSFDTRYQTVFHFNEFEGTPRDSSTYAAHSSDYTGGLGLAGVIGNGATFSGGGNFIKILDNPVFDFSRGMTFSTWVKIFQAQDDAWLFSRAADDKKIIIAIRETKLIVEIHDGDQFFINDATTDIPLEGWHHLAVTIAPEGRVTIYLDGNENQWMDIKADLTSLSGDLWVGADVNGEHSFAGDLDEMRISGIPRSEGWLRGAIASQGPAAGLCSYSIEEIGEGESGLPVFYLATIFNNITLDGLVVILLLLFLSGCSWVVMISKGVFLFNTVKGNNRFLREYQANHDPVALETGSNVFDSSGLYRIYEAGCQSLDFKNPNFKEEDNTEKKMRFSSKVIDQLKASLEKGLIEESRRLNSWLIILIMSISGGPFLGLLGTVWGVMNTFAAMADAGEANIMAIAPGVASALSTTVFGLIVAIPALFGYNYLIGKIRDITADAGMFVDQFALNVDVLYGDES